MTIKQVGMGVAAVLGALVLPASASAGSITNAPDSYSKQQSAVSSEGWSLEGEVSNIPDPRGGTLRFSADLVLPDGTVAGNGPQREGEPDLRKPWVSLVEERHAVNPASPELPAHMHTVCTNFANPSSYRGGDPETDWTPDVYADVTCDDGRGYDFYRVHWDFTLHGYYEETPLVWLEPAVKLPVGHGTKYGTYPTTPGRWHWSGFGSTTVTTKPYYTGAILGVIWNETARRPHTTVSFRVCGHRGSQVDCLEPSPVQGYGGPYDPVRAYVAKLSPLETDAKRNGPDIW